MDGLKKVQVQLLDAESGEVLEDVNPLTDAGCVSYSNDTPMVSAHGGIPAGTTFDNVPIKKVLDDILYPYTKPTISFAANPGGGIKEKGAVLENVALTATITKKSEDIKKVEFLNGAAAVSYTHLSFVESTQEYVTQQQYAVSLSIGTLVQDDLEGSNIVSQVNQFYADKQGELAALGTELNETITDAFTDGLLDMDEVEEISKLQEQIAHIKSALAGSDFEAGLDLIATKYGGQQLDADSFQNLQAEIQGQMENAISSYDEAYTCLLYTSRIRCLRDDTGWMKKRELTGY